MPPKRLLAVSAAATLAAGAAQDDTQPRGLLDATPEDLRTANYVLSKAFERGAKDMDAYVLVTRLLLQHALDLADQSADRTLDYQRAALPISYNLAANTWPGWDAEAPPISDRNRRFGLEAARLDAELAAEAAPTVQRRVNGQWILGAHLIAAGAYDAAATAFETARDLAADAGLEPAATVAQGWIHVANTLNGRDETDALAAVEQRLAAQGGDGPFYAAQYATALQVFERATTD